MFNGGTKGQGQRALRRSDSGDHSVTILTSGCHFTGKLYCSGSTRIGGVIEGEIVSDGVLIVEERAKIRADIKAEEVVLQGEVEGKVEAKVRLELYQSGKFSGDIFTPVLVMQEGAQFNGRSVMPINGIKTQQEMDDSIEAPEVRAVLEGAEKGSPEVSLL